MLIRLWIPADALQKAGSYTCRLLPVEDPQMVVPERHLLERGGYRCAVIRKEERMGRLVFQITLTVIHDPDAIERAEEFVAHCLAQRLWKA